jgi:hypothetical protein
MPYIVQEHRAIYGETLAKLLDNLLLQGNLASGDVNYIITRIADYVFTHSGANYSAGKDVLGTLEAVKLEFYRRRMAPYEDKKAKQNGEVFA